jgi:hypothetical protein
VAFTLAQLRTRAQYESDNVNAGFVSSAEWTTYINASYEELYGLLVQAWGSDYYVATPYTFDTDGTNNLFALPSDFFKLLGVDLQVQASNLWVTLKPFAMAERNRFGLINSPVPMAGQTIRLWYVPTITALSGDSDSTVAILNGWEEYIVIDAAMKALAKEESDVSVLALRKAAILKRIEMEAEQRDAGMPAHIVDAYAAISPAMMYRLNGSNIWLIGGNTPAYPYGGAYMGNDPPWGWGNY